MKKQDFVEKSPGELIYKLSGDLAFVPFALPPKIIWVDSLVKTLAIAAQAMGALSGAGRELQSPHRLVRMFLRREAEMSSKIEDTFASVQTMALLENLPEVEQQSPSVREVNNNFEALKFAVESIEYRPLGQSMIKEMHAFLLRGVRGQDKTPGQYRVVQAHIGRSFAISEATFVPCPPLEIEPAMSALESFLKNPDDTPPIIRAAMAHYQFETIHPFADGNGRVGRALLLLQLLKEKVLPAPLLNPSAQLEKNREEYYNRLLGVSQKGDWNGWFEFFARCLANEAEDALRRIERLEDLRTGYQAQIRKVRASVALASIVDHLFIEPSVTVHSISTALKLPMSTAANLMNKLLEMGMLREVTGRARNRVYLAQAIIDIFSTNNN